MISRLTDWLLGLDGLPIYAIVGLLVFAEDALFVGFVLPGETAAVLGGVAASLGHAALPVVLAVVIGGAVVGDSIGYEVGRQFGPRLLKTRPLQRHAHRLGNARDLLARRGGTAVFLGRFTAFFRATMPALAGIAEMPYLKFLRWNVAGGVFWGAAVVLIGYLAGNSYEKVEKTFGRVTGLVLVAAVVTGLTVWHLRRRRAEVQD
ncbi:MAG TPA: DedA family protein [Kribbellaceae bacterium]